MPKIRTLAELVFVSIPHYNKPDCLMTKKGEKYSMISAKEVSETVESISAALIAFGARKGDRVALLSENRPEWTYADLGILCAGAITVPIYGTLPPKQIEYILRDSETEIIFVSTESQLRKVLEIKSGISRLRKIILFDEVVQLPADASALCTVIQEGKRLLASDTGMVRQRAKELQPDDVFTIVYTSGTTGEPKGVMLTHHNLISNIEGIQGFFQFTPQDRSLSFLPLSHVFERMAGYYSLLHEGCAIAYAESIDALPRNLLEVRPTILMSVPRVYEKFYARLMDNVAAEQGLKKELATWALRIAAELANRKANQSPLGPLFRIRYAIADRLVLSKIRSRLGGRLRLMVSGGAALPRQLGLFFYGIGLTILEGYGLTETSPVIACNRPGQFKFGTVGPPIPGVEVKIAEDGEVLTRGPHVMKGYYKKPQTTAEAVGPDGWFHTGDIGEIDLDGFLRITDRKKDLIVTSAGKNVAPQFVENTVKTSKYITQIVVVGDKRNFPSALIVPNVDNLRKFAVANQIPETEILTHPAILEEVQQDIDRLSQDLAPFERIKKIALLGKEFTVESGEMTPSLKIKRNIVEKKYKDLIDRFYAEPAPTR